MQIDKSHPKVKTFVKHIKNECKKYGIKCDLRPVQSIMLNEAGIRCSGYFDEYEKVLACSMKSPIWLSVLAHEYCHLTQWLDLPQVWIDVVDYDSGNKMDKWLNGGRVKNHEKHIDRVRDLELDNEKRTVQCIKDFGLDEFIDINLYIRRANSYVQFHNYMKVIRRWYIVPNTPYSNEYILDRMPSKFNMNYDKMSDKVLKIFKNSGI